MTNLLFDRVTEFHYGGNVGSINVTESATSYGLCPHFLYQSSTADSADAWTLGAQGYFHNVRGTSICIQ